MKTLTFLTLGFISAIFALSGVVMADEGIQEGNWELTSTVDVKADGNGKVVPSVTKTECVTNADPIANVRKMAQEYSGCAEPQLQKNGGTVDYSVACSSDAGQMSMSGHFVYAGATMQGTASASAVMQGRSSNIKMNIVGKYIGPC